MPTATPVSLPLVLLSPPDGIGVETGAVRVLGVTRNDAAVAVNGRPVEVASDGSFYRDVVLQEGTNLIEVVASDGFSLTAHKQVVVFSTSTTAGLPFTLFYPKDGTMVSRPHVWTVGGVRQDATVGVNGTPVDVSALGIFSAKVPLQEGINIIEVVSSDINGNVRFQTVAVFYTP